MASKNELCNVETNKPKNTGHLGNECLEGVLVRVFIAKNGFRFPTFADFKDKSKWLLAIATKDIVPLYDAYAVTAANVAAKKYESRNFSIETEKAVKKTDFESYLGFCSHAALASYEHSNYDQVFEFTDELVAGVYDIDGIKIKGQDLKNFNVGIRNIPTDAKPAFSKVEMTFRDYKELEKNYAIAKPVWSQSDLNGILDVLLEKVSNTATLIKIKASLECSGGKITVFTAANFIVKNVAGVVQTPTSITYNIVDDTYDIVGTGFTTGFTIDLNGVVSFPSTSTNYENIALVTL